MKIHIITLLLCLLGMPLWAQVEEIDQKKLENYQNYIAGLLCYQKTLGLPDTINKAFQAGNIKAVRQLTAERETLLMQTIDSVLKREAGTFSTSESAYLINRLCFHLGWKNVEKVLGYFDAAANHPYLDELRSRVEKEKRVQPGAKAFPFELWDREGKRYTLDSLRGKYIFLEFTASWCSWCKKELPVIRKAYKRFGDKVVFISVSLDEAREKWLQDLDKQALPWLCLSDLKGWKSPVAKAYYINGIPDCLVIDPDGIIRARGLRGTEIEETLTELLSPGIRFEHSTFTEALEKASQAGKKIFMDCYTSWCAPCQMMNRTVFTDPEVGEFFNVHFINVKFDMEKGEGVQLSKRYGMQVFPTYLLLDAEGNELHRVVGGHDAKEFIELIRNGMENENSISGFRKRYEAGERELSFLRDYITVLGGGYRYNEIPAIVNDICRQSGTEISREDWEVTQRYLSDPLSYAFRYVAENRAQIQNYISAEELEKWIYKMLYVSIFNTINEVVYDEKEAYVKRLVALREVVEVVRPERTDYLVAMLDYYDAFYHRKMNSVLKIFKKKFMKLSDTDRFGPELWLNAMLYDRGNSKQCRKGLDIFQQLFAETNPMLKNIEKLLNERIDKLNN